MNEPSSSIAEEDLELLDAMRLVQDLHQLSSELAKDATEDDLIFSKAAGTMKASGARREQ